MTVASAVLPALHAPIESDYVLRRLILVTTECAEWATPGTLAGVEAGLGALIAATPPATGILAGSDDEVLDVAERQGAEAVRAVRKRLADHQERILGGDVTLPREDEGRFCRLVLDPGRLADVMGMPAGKVVDAGRFFSCAVEFAFRQHRKHVFCHVTLALYTHQPHQAGFRPPWNRPERESPMAADEVRDDLAFFVDDLREAFQSWLARQGFSSVVFRVFGRAYRSPAFVVAVPYEHKKQRKRAAAGLSKSFLRAGERDLDVGSSMFFQNIKVVRRLVAIEPDGTHRAEDHPRYMVVPGRLLPDVTSGTEAADLLVGQERASAELLRTFINIEASAAASLFELDTRFDRIGAHLEVYESVALQAADLWDALALHLSRRGSELRHAHRSVELLHNTLLQGVADLDQLATEIREQMEYVDNVADGLRDRLNQASAERPLNDHSVRDSITGGGYFDRLRELGRQRMTKALNVQATYESLLGAMAHAFDERRARESDMAEKSGLPIGVAVGVLGLVTVVQTTVDVAPQVSPGWEWGLRIGCWAIGAAALVALVIIYVKVSRVSRLGSEEFDRRYLDLAAYLQASSTVVLNEFGKAATPADWARKDAELATQFEDVWRDAFSTRPPTMLEPGDLELLRTRTEDFCLRALLLAERPRDFSLYKLPRLTRLYRSKASEMFVTPASEPVTLVSNSEVRGVVAAGGDAETIAALEKYLEDPD